MVRLPELRPLIAAQGRSDAAKIEMETFKSIREMKRILLGDRSVIERINEEKMEISEEYLSPGNEAEVVAELLDSKFNWIINLGSIITWIFHGIGGSNTWNKVDDNDNCWRSNELVSEFVMDTIYEFFQLLLRNPEAHANARNCNHMFCSFWPYAVWAYKQVVDKILSESKEWNSNLERVTKAIWTSYSIDPYKDARTAIDPFKRAMRHEASDGGITDKCRIYLGANQVLNKFRQVALNAMKEKGVQMPGISILYYDLKATVHGDYSTALVPSDSINALSFDEKMLLKPEIESGMWQVETSLLIPMGIYSEVESLSYLDKVCQGFFN